MEKELAHSLAGVADVERKGAELQGGQSEQDVVTLMGTGEPTVFRGYDQMCS